MNISGTTGHWMTVKYPILSNVCSCTTWGKQNQQNMSRNEQKYIKKHPQHYWLWHEEGLTDFNHFWCKHFKHYLPSNDHSSNHLTKCLLLHYMGEPEQAELDKNAIFHWFCFPISAEADNGCCGKLDILVIANCVRNYWCQKLLKSGNLSSSYNWKCLGYPDPV